ncbi:hypothetical protein FMM80_24735 [Schaedlerella arabinosiphila]|uniref:Uncharacterized protein n=1 Tax=Schaedlerella arabinosiphila TaxID=2044587 RepID=A0A9X5CCG2_9FIRM|nr:hypothetical protein [Schaedlerella arabinosiphila]NDO71683.1 hypothetical protein [Schaedlerella arabinosiphila]
MGNEIRYRWIVKTSLFCMIKISMSTLYFAKFLTGRSLLMLQNRKITVGEISPFFTELIDSDIKELEAEVMQLT